MTNALAREGRKDLGSRRTYTKITKQIILSRTKIARKHQFLSRCPSLRPKQEGGKPEENKSKEFHGKDTPSDIPTMIYVPRSTRGRHLGRGSAVTLQSCQFKENTRIEFALCLKTMPCFVAVHTFCASQDGSRNSAFFRMVFRNSN